MAKNSNQIVIISGATCTNKSQLACEFALDFAIQKRGAIINADAFQVYQDLKILSAQPSEIQQASVDHYLYSCLEYREKCDVVLWLKMVKDSVEKIINKNQIPIITGGTGLYISKLIDGISLMPKISIEAKEQAQKLFLELGFNEFQKQFGNEKIIDKQRLIRACEILLSTGKNIEFWQKQPTQKIFPDTKFIHVNLNLDRKIIYHNCNQRLVKMLENGAIKEVDDFMQKNNDDDLAICKTLGYHEIKAYLQKKISYQEMVEIIQKKTRNYAKRQLTWFRHQFDEINFFENTQLAKKFLNQNF